MYATVMSLPLFVMMNFAVPSLSVQTPVAVRFGGGGGVTQVDIFAWMVNLLSFGLASV